MLTSEFDYNLPSELIAQEPAVPRDSSRLMVVDKGKQIIEHKHFYDILDYLQPGDLLVWNNSKVFKARLFGELESVNNQELLEHKKEIEVFLVREMENEGVWKVLAKPGRHLREGMRVRFAPDFYCDAMVKEKDGTILVQFEDSADVVRSKANKYGQVPVPPYISQKSKVKSQKSDSELVTDYQTVYAKYEGSVAAPTAGFHFTDELIEKLKNKGVEFAEVTLHVGLGTFLPVKSENVEEHKMHSEWVELSQENADKINCAKREGRRVVAVGTTTVRTLEGIVLRSLPFRGGGQGGGLVQKLNSGVSEDPTPNPTPMKGGEFLCPYKGDINIFITPGFEFKVVDAMITNFHLPKSTLLMLVSAFVNDRGFVLDCYKKAVEEKYRFYSFGDAMFIT